jgi:uncharacterized protein (TIGR04255 family)
VETETLTNPPIIEALIELRFSPSESVTLEELESFTKLMSIRYPISEPIFAQSIEVAFKGEHTSKINAYPSGYKLKNLGENRFIICAIDRLAVSFHTPYVSWPALRNVAETTYKSYSEQVSHGKLVRLGMRYINKVKMPLTGKLDFDQYIKTMPNLPKTEGIPDALVNFETLVVIPFGDIQSTATVKQVLLRPETSPDNPPSLPFILDIDISREFKGVVVDSSIWALLDMFRLKKNQIFFASLTDAALEPYK